jgi:hypothetical protein
MKMRFLFHMVSHYQKKHGGQSSRNEIQKVFKRTQISDTMVEMLHNGNEHECYNSTQLRECCTNQVSVPLLIV